MITSPNVAAVLDVAATNKKVTRESFERAKAFKSLASDSYYFHGTIMRTVRRLADSGLLSRKKEGVYAITREGRTALKRFDSR